MVKIPIAELILDTHQYLQCLAPHVKERKAALLLSRLVTEIERLQEERADVKVCKLMHTVCGACGMAIHEEGGCGCGDNKHQPIADIHADIRSKQQSEIERLRGELYKNAGRWESAAQSCDLQATECRESSQKAREAAEAKGE